MCQPLAFYELQKAVIFTHLELIMILFDVLSFHNQWTTHL